LIISKELEYLDKDNYLKILQLIESEGKQLQALISKLKEKPSH